MDFLSNLGEVLTEAGKNVSQKAKDLTEIAKLNLEIRQKEDHVRRQYIDIGKAYFELHENEAEPPTEEEKALYEGIVRIKDAHAEIARLEAELIEMKRQKKYAEHDSSTDKESKTCSPGEEFEFVKDEEEHETKKECDGDIEVVEVESVFEEEA